MPHTAALEERLSLAYERLLSAEKAMVTARVQYGTPLAVRQSSAPGGVSQQLRLQGLAEEVAGLEAALAAANHGVWHVPPETS